MTELCAFENCVKLAYIKQGRNVLHHLNILHDNKDVAKKQEKHQLYEFEPFETSKIKYKTRKQACHNKSLTYDERNDTTASNSVSIFSCIILVLIQQILLCSSNGKKMWVTKIYQCIPILPTKK